jgi:hypothetical protein
MDTISPRGYALFYTEPDACEEIAYKETWHEQALELVVRIEESSSKRLAALRQPCYH